jgi:hypothetical protein
MEENERADLWIDLPPGQVSVCSEGMYDFILNDLA